MKNIFNKIIGLWNVYGGIAISTFMAWLTDFAKASMDNITSFLVLTLTCISVLTFFKIMLFKQKSNGLVDTASMSQQSIKALKTAVDPVASGEEIGKTIVETYYIMKRSQKIMRKVKKFLDRFKGYLLAALGVAMSFIEAFGGYMNALLGDKLIVNGVNILVLITLVISVIIAGLSNGRTSEQNEKVKALFSKSSSNELVVAEIKKTLKEDENKLKQDNKKLENKQTELENLNAALVSAKNTYNAKVQMSQLTVPLATTEDIASAFDQVHNCELDVINKQSEIDEAVKGIASLTTIINALKSQLQG